MGNVVHGRGENWVPGTTTFEHIRWDNPNRNKRRPVSFPLMRHFKNTDGKNKTGKWTAIIKILKLLLGMYSDWASKKEN